MTNEILDPSLGCDVSHISVFESMPCCSILLMADEPRYTIEAVTVQYQKLTGNQKKDMIGKGIAEVFSVGTLNSAYVDVQEMGISLEQVIKSKEPHRFTIQQQDFSNDGSSITKYWEVTNTPVLTANDNVSYIIHTVKDSTDIIKRREEADFSPNESQELLQALFDASPNSLSVFEPFYKEGKVEDLKFVMVNDFTVKTTGRGDLAGKLYAREFPNVKGTGVLDAFIKVMETGIPADFEKWYEGEGLRHWFRFIVNKVGQFLVVTTEDITNRKEAERKMEESESKFRTMAESTPVLITVGNEKGDITYYNTAWTDLTGKATAELLLTNWAALIHPEDRDGFAAIFFNAFAVKEPFTGEFRVLNTAGEYRWLLAHGVPRFSSSGNFVGYISACTDITEHKKSQEQLQTALEQVRLSKEAAELGTFDMDLEQGTMHWDERCRILFGISHQGPVTYEKDFVEGLHPDDRERVTKLIDEVFVKSISNGDYDVEYRTVGVEDGVIRWVRAKGKAYFNSGEKPVRFIGSVLDITDQVNALQKIEKIVEERTQELAQVNDRLQQYNLELQRSNKNLEEFAHAASHDMKEPIRKVLTFADRLKTSLGPRMNEIEKQLFNRMEISTQRMGLLVDDLLEFSHVSERPLKKEEVDLKQKLVNVLADLELLIEEKKASIQVGALPVIKGHKRQLQQLLQNLVGNALKYSKKDQAPVVTISSSIVLGREVAEKVLPEQMEQHFHLIEVRDNGIGFQPEYAERIFGMFQRLHGKAEYPGTGVGLSIARKVVENHNGYIWAESTPGEGATFKFLLPVE